MVWASSASILQSGSSPTMLQYLPGKTKIITLTLLSKIAVECSSGLSAGMYIPVLL